MRTSWVIAALALGGCGLESIFTNAGHDPYERPASAITGMAGEELDISQIAVLDPSGTALTPFLAEKTGAAYEIRLPSSKYSMLRVRAMAGNGEMRAIVPGIGEESMVAGVDLDDRNMTETLITEARLSADGDTLAKVTPEAYLGTRALIRAAFDMPGHPAQRLLDMVTRIRTKYDPTLSVLEPLFFRVPVLMTSEDGTTITVMTSPLEPGFIQRNPFDYVGDGVVRSDSGAFDATLIEAAKLFRPAGCPDPSRIRVVFTVDFNDGSKSGNCGGVNKFLWASNKPGKSMYFVGWIYDGSAGQPASDIQDPAVAMILGNSTPNVIPMYDDGTNGDETAGDNVWSIFFDLPRSSPGRVFRMGYKYTWGTSGAPWTGSEEWPGNSRILEVVDDNGDDFVYRRDVFADEATNKDKSNSNLMGMGSITWTTDLHSCGTPTAHENAYDNNACTCGSVPTPEWLGPLTVTCTE